MGINFSEFSFVTEKSVQILQRNRRLARFNQIKDSHCKIQKTKFQGERWLSARIKEHHPTWLIKGRTGNIRSAIVQHLVDSGHRINPDQAFSVYYQMPSNLPRPVKFRTLCTAEAVSIRILKPVLCLQKQISHPLSLPWPDIRVARP